MKKWKLKNNVDFILLIKYGYMAWFFGARKRIKRNKRNDVEITFNRYGDITIAYYYKREFVGYVKYRQEKYLNDLIKAGLVEVV